MLLLAAETAPARGAPIEDIIPSAIVGIIAALLLGAFMLGHRKGRIKILHRIGAWSDRALGIPGVASIPVAVCTTSLLIAAFGFYWDVSWHINRGRDAGPLANPAHWFIIVGLAGIALAGVLAVAMQTDDDEVDTAVRVRPGWSAPVGGVLLAVCGLIALAGFPLDDVWHRIFGQDVTLWGPTHIQMVGGASLATLAMWSLTVEGRRAASHAPTSRLARLLDARDVASGGALLIGLSTLQGEFDFGVPQFRILYHPVLIALAAGVALVAVRIRAGRGAAIGAALFFLGFRFGLTLLIGPVLGRSTLHFPMYLIEALIVEGVALVISRDKQLNLGLWAGLGIGTVGTLGEFVWSNVWMPIPWQAHLLPRALPLTALAGVAAGIIGAFIGRALAPMNVERQATPRGVAVVAWLAAFAAIAIPAPMSTSSVTAAVSLTEAAGAGGRHVHADVRLAPASAADNADWLNVTSWQGAGDGEGGLVLQELEKVGPGHYRTTEPVPVFGTWKSLVRLAKGTSLQVAPIYLPDDPVIPADGVPAVASFTRPFVADKQLLQREAVGGSLGLQRTAYAILVILAGCWIGSLGWGLRRLDRAATAARRPEPRGPRDSGKVGSAHAA